MRGLAVLLLVLFLLAPDGSQGYVVVVREDLPEGSVLFFGGVGAFKSHLRIDKVRSGSGAHHILTMRPDGALVLRRRLDCSGASHPNPLGVYLEASLPSISDQNHDGADAVFLPLRLLVLPSKSGANVTCRPHVTGHPTNPHMAALAAERSAPPWAAATLVSLPLVSWRQQEDHGWPCLRQSQFLADLLALLPDSVRRKCRPTFMAPEPSKWVRIQQHHHGDGEPYVAHLVSAKDQCMEAATWRINVTVDLHCVEDNDAAWVASRRHLLRVLLHGRGVSGDYWPPDDALRGSRLSVGNRLRREMSRNQAPFFPTPLVTATVTEEKASGLSVTTMAARDPEGGPLTYSMVSLLDARSQSQFAIDERTGAVRTSTRLDRETMDAHFFRITAVDSGLPPRSATATLQVRVSDVNDNPPLFEQQQYEAHVREGANAVGATLLTLRASDQDSGANAQVRYSLQATDGDADAFRVDARSGVLTTRLPLDRETRSSYVLTVLAEDQAPVQQRLTASTTVNVNVIDDNDNYPQFSRRSYSVKLREDLDASRAPIVATVSAVDADDGANAAVRYAIIGGNPQGQFAIDPMTGDVTLLQSLDYEAARSYRLVIRAQDGGTPARSNNTQLVVEVEDVNDNAPRFYSERMQESIAEDSPVGTSVLRLQAYDADDGPNGRVSYWLTGPGSTDDTLPFAVDAQTGWITTKKELDREGTPRYRLDVLARDDGSPTPLSATARVTITVQDVNDNDPEFDHPLYEGSVAEDAAPGTTVLTLVAHDADIDLTSDVASVANRLHFAIVDGNSRARFAIATQGTGVAVVSVAQPLDFRREQRFVMTVTATDAGGRSGRTSVVVTVLDANSFAPAFEGAPYSASVFEDAVIGSTVLVLSASDGDAGANAEVTFSFAGDAPPEFSLERNTGALVLAKPLDREAVLSYLLTVIASDAGQPPLSDTTDVEVLVADVNDNAPVFLRSSYDASVREDAPVGTSVLRVSASDADAGLNARVRYALSAEDSPSFSVDPTSGVIRTWKSLDRETIPRYDLVVLAVDRGSPEMTGSASVIITIEDVNDSPPEFESERMVLYVAENSPPGATVGKIQAHDPDEGDNAHVTYAIVGGDDADAFTLVTRPERQLAELLTRAALDYESPRKRFELVVRASSPPLRSDVHVEVHVLDVNDNAPVLRDFHVVFNNYRDCFPIGSVGRVPATDADVSDKLTYRVISGNNAGLVSLNSSTGEITLSSRLDSNVPLRARMRVAVTDGVNTAEADMTLVSRMVTPDMLFNSVTLRLGDVTLDSFLSPTYFRLQDALAALIPAAPQDVLILSLRQDDDGLSADDTPVLNVSVSVRSQRGSWRHRAAWEDDDDANTGDESFMTPQFLQERIYLHRSALAKLAQVRLLPFEDNLCVREPCLNYETCTTVLKFANASSFVSGDSLLFRPIHPVTTFACTCPPGFTGMREHYLCDTEVDLCYSSPCANGGTCWRREGGYTCECADGFAGRHCDVDLSTATCSVSPGLCAGGSRCAPLIQGGFLCENCSLITGPGAAPGSTTPLCRLRARSFSGAGSFLTFPALRQRHRLHLKLSFATTSPDALLLYDGRYNHRHDFVRLQVVNSTLQFVFSLGAGVATTLRASVPGGVSDGRWHTATVQYFNRSAVMSIDECDTELVLRSGTSLPAEWRCAATAAQQLESRCSHLTETCQRFLDLTGPLQLGGIPPGVVITPTADEGGASPSLQGCLRDVEVDHTHLDLQDFVGEGGTEAGCGEKAPHCQSAPCRNGGTCRDDLRWGSFHCTCADGWGGRDCTLETGPSWQLNGNKSAIVFIPPLRPLQLPWVNSLSFRTLQQDSVLMTVHFGQNHTAVLHLKNGHPSYTLDGHQLSQATLPSRLDDGAWHHLEAKWMAGEVWLSSDYGLHERTAVLSEDPIREQPQGMYVDRVVMGRPGQGPGAAPGPPLIGCMRHVRVGSVGAVQHAHLLARPSVEEGVGKGCRKIEGTPQCSAFSGQQCKCDVGFVGPECTPACAFKPCDANASCTQAPGKKLGYSCDCSNTDHTGTHCEIPPLPSAPAPCPANWWGAPSCGPCRCDASKGLASDCDKKTGECRCLSHHYRQGEPSGAGQGEGPCLPCMCDAVGAFAQDCAEGTGQCRCRSGVVGRRCDRCPSPFAEVTLRGCEVVYDACPRSHTASIWWERTRFGTTAVAACPEGSEGKATRLCDQDNGWEAPDLFNCTSAPFVPLRRLLHQIEVGDVEEDSSVMVHAMGDIRGACNATSGNLYGAELLVAWQLVQRVLDWERRQTGMALAHKQERQFLPNLCWSSSCLLEPELAPLWPRLASLTGQRQPLQRLLASINWYLALLADNQRDTYTAPFEVAAPNLVLALDLVRSGTQLRLDSAVGGGVRRQQILQTDTGATLLYNNDVASDDTSAAMVVLPKYDNFVQDPNRFESSARVLVPRILLGLPLGLQTQSDGGEAVVSYAQFRTLGKLLTAMKLGPGVNQRRGANTRPDGPLMSLVIRPSLGPVTGPVPGPSALSSDDDDDDIDDSGHRIRFVFQVSQASSTPEPQCVYWDPQARSLTEEELGAWSATGCWTETWEELSEAVMRVNCSCHASLVAPYPVALAFGVLVAEKEAWPPLPEPSPVEEAATYLGFVLALLLLSATLLALCLLRRPSSNSGAIHRQLVLCLLLAQLLYLLALKTRATLGQREFPCRLVAMALHYLWLCTFCWLLLDAVHLYRMLTEMRDVNHGRMRFYLGVGYGAPALVLALAVGVRASQYGSYMFCWLSLYDPAVWALVGPVCVLVFANAVALSMALRAAFTLKDHVAHYGNLRTLLWLNVALVPMAGATWALALLAATEPPPLLRFLLALSELLLAVLVLAGHCVANSRVRRSLVFLWRHRRCWQDDNIKGTSTVRHSRRPQHVGASSATVTTSSSSYRRGVAVAGAPSQQGSTAQPHPRRVIVGVSTSSTTSHSTCKTNSSPHRPMSSASDGLMALGSQHRHLHSSRRRSNRAEIPSSSAGPTGESDSESDGSLDRLERRGLELASSHSSDEEDPVHPANAGRGISAGLSASSRPLLFRPNIVSLRGGGGGSTGGGYGYSGGVPRPVGQTFTQTLGGRWGANGHPAGVGSSLPCRLDALPSPPSSTHHPHHPTFFAPSPTTSALYAELWAHLPSNGDPSGGGSSPPTASDNEQDLGPSTMSPSNKLLAARENLNASDWSPKHQRGPPDKFPSRHQYGQTPTPTSPSPSLPPPSPSLPPPLPPLPHHFPSLHPLPPLLHPSSLQLRSLDDINNLNSGSSSQAAIRSLHRAHNMAAQNISDAEMSERRGGDEERAELSQDDGDDDAEDTTIVTGPGILV